MRTIPFDAKDKGHRDMLREDMKSARFDGYIIQRNYLSDILDLADERDKFLEDSKCLKQENDRLLVTIGRIAANMQIKHDEELARIRAALSEQDKKLQLLLTKKHVT